MLHPVRSFRLSGQGSAARLAAAAVALSASLFPGGSQAAPPQRVIPMKAEFIPGYSVSGVGGVYSQGEDSVDCDINLSSGDFRLNINNNRARYLIADLSQSVSPCPVMTPPPTPWVSPLTDISFVNVNKIKDMPVSSDWVPKGAFFLSRSAGQLRFAQGNLNPFCSTTVWVQHPSGNTWRVRATTDEMAVLAQSFKNEVVPVGYFSLPFELNLTMKE
jgi:hypothetical protein